MTRELVSAFSISGASLGLLSSGYFYPYALMQLPVGVLADSWGARKTIALFSTIGAAGAILFGLAPNFHVATAARILVGFGLSAVFVPAMRVCAGLFNPKEYAAVSGLLLAMGGVGWFYRRHPPDMDDGCLRMAGDFCRHRLPDDPAGSGHLAAVCRKNRRDR